jgi:hypothetical protein
VYQISERVVIERTDLDGTVRLELKPGKCDLTAEELALVEANAPGVAVPVKEQEN